MISNNIQVNYLHLMSPMKIIYLNMFLKNLVDVSIYKIFGKHLHKSRFIELSTLVHVSESKLILTRPTRARAKRNKMLSLGIMLYYWSGILLDICLC